MFWLIKYILLGGISFIGFGCSKFNSGQQQSGKADKKAPVINRDTDTINQAITAPMAGPEQNSDRIAPGTCRIIGQVIRILPKLEANENTPCGQMPCTALVQVQNVLGYGAAFNQSLTPKQEIKVYFSFTLNATNKLFPELTSPLPGLKPGDTFLTDLQYLSEQHLTGEHLYKVNFYKVLQ